MDALQLRVSRKVKGRIIARSGGKKLWERRVDTRPQRRIFLPLAELDLSQCDGEIELYFAGC
jgi:hypothetical protein